jgi:3-methyladenine DNA glycosylase/8-oxoguanine DNA glycosylase
MALFPHGKFPLPEEVAALRVERLTTVGFSRAKAGYVQEIARNALAGVLPGRREIARLSDEEIVERLTAIKGVGRWSVEMFLMFGLGRPDVLPVHDFGVRRGFALAFQKRELPTPEQLRRHGERWRPCRSTAAWYLWRRVDLADAKARRAAAQT